MKVALIFLLLTLAEAKIESYFEEPQIIRPPIKEFVAMRYIGPVFDWNPRLNLIKSQMKIDLKMWYL